MNYFFLEKNLLLLLILMYGWSTLFWVLFLQFQLGVNVQWVTSAGVWGGGVMEWYG